MGQVTNQIEQEIRETRSELGRNLEALEDKAREFADWRTHYRNHPSLFLGVALGAGLAVGLAAIPAPRRRAHALDSSHGLDLSHGPDWSHGPDVSHDPYPQEHVRPAWSARNQTIQRAKRQLGETLDQIADGLLRTASAKALEFVSGFVPGFDDHLDRPATARNVR